MSSFITKENEQNNRFHSYSLKSDKYDDSSLRLKRQCGIPDSIQWGDHRIFLYEEGVKRELRRKDSIINHWRDSVRIARKL